MCRFLGRCPGFSCGSHTPNRLLGHRDGAQGFRADNPKPRNDSGHGCQVLRENFFCVWCTRSSTVDDDTVCSVWLQELSRSARCRTGHVPQQHVTVLKTRGPCRRPRMAEHGCSPAAPTNRQNQPPPPAAPDLGHVKGPISLRCPHGDLGHVEKVRSGLLLLILHVPSKAASAAGHPKTTPDSARQHPGAFARAQAQARHRSQANLTVARTRVCNAPCGVE